MESAGLGTTCTIVKSGTETTVFNAMQDLSSMRMEYADTTACFMSLSKATCGCKAGEKNFSLRNANYVTLMIVSLVISQMDLVWNVGITLILSRPTFLILPEDAAIQKLALIIA